MAKKDVLVILKDAKSNSILLHGAFVLPPKFVGMFSHEPPWIKLKIITLAVLWVTRAPYEMTKIPFRGLSHRCFKGCFKGCP
jgi:hypothetical protein